MEATPYAGSYDDDTIGAQVGVLLRRAREARGLTLQHISDETRIPLRHLEAIDRDNLAALPGGFYLRADVRAYARAVDVEPDHALALLDRAMRPAAPAQSPVVPPFANSAPAIAAAPSPRASLPLMTLLLVAVAATFYALGRFDARRELIPLPPSGAETSERAETAVVTPPVTPPATPATPAVPERPSEAVVAEVPAPDAAATGADAARTLDVTSSDSETVPPVSSTLPIIVPAPGPSETEVSRMRTIEPATQLVVTTRPAGAFVTVDGIGWGKTPATIRYLPEGRKRVRVSAGGYVTEVRQVTRAEGRRVTVDSGLSPAQ
jgi:cytoskeleton protein RodZ